MVVLRREFLMRWVTEIHCRTFWNKYHWLRRYFLHHATKLGGKKLQLIIFSYCEQVLQAAHENIQTDWIICMFRSNISCQENCILLWKKLLYKIPLHQWMILKTLRFFSHLVHWKANAIVLFCLANVNDSADSCLNPQDIFSQLLKNKNNCICYSMN